MSRIPATMGVLLLTGSILLGGMAEGKWTKNIQVTHQAWIDRVGAQRCEHGLCLIHPFIKVDPSQLDGAIVEVGFMGKSMGTRQGQPYLLRRQVLIADRTFGRDTFGFSTEISVKSDFHQGTIKGAFYIKTRSGTRYWITNQGKGFTFDLNAFQQVANRLGPGPLLSSDPAQAVSTQIADGFGLYYNPLQLR
jgi:hypothetical protein